MSRDRLDRLEAAVGDLAERMDALDARHPPPAMLGPALRIARVKAGWTGRQLADALGVAQSTVTRWETGQRVIGVGVAEAIRDCFRRSGADAP